ncbi:MAG TPA: tetratricopeptide repeat protein [Candidatus Angelobacter sp.]|nr:tetratricopeptide repeat protein [Candidatus Angelobacter sp.]
MVVVSRLLSGFAVLLFVVAVASPISSQQSSPGDAVAAPRVPPPSASATAADLEEEGDTLRGQKAYLDAIDYYRASIKKANSAALHNKAGISFFQLFRDHDAKKEYEQSIKLDKTYAEAHNNLGALYYREQRYGQAIKEYKRAIRINDLNASFHSNLGTAYFSAKAFDEASHEYIRALALDPEIFDRKPSGGVSIRMISSNDLGHFHYVMAQMYGQHGDQEHCRYYLAKANEEGYPIRDALHDDQFSTLRKDPTFLTFVRSLKPPPTNE